MEKYNYLEAMTQDVINYLNANAEEYYEVADAKELSEKLNEDLWCDDSVTGKASGSTWRAEEYLCHNLYLLQEACTEFGCAPKLDSPEWCDATIRCYLLPQAIQAALDNWDVAEEA